MPKKEDLRNVVNPKGRIDVAAYKLGERFVRNLEEQHGYKGVWDSIEPHVQDMVRAGLSGLEIPGEAKALVNILALNHEKILNPGK